MILKNILLITFVFFCIKPVYNQTGVLDNYNLSINNSEQFELVSELNEISGIAATKDGRLFAHNDEEGFIYQLDPKSGRVMKYFFLGKEKVLNDFEGLAIEGVNFYLIASNGDLYSFFEQPDGQYSSYKKTNIGIDPSYNLEGLCYDPGTFSLLITCKENTGTEYPNSKVVFSYSLSQKKINPEPRFIISIDELYNRFRITDFSPSSIERHPIKDTFFILSSKEKAMIEVAKDGKILSGIKLSKKTHKKPESITFDINNNILIGDEGKKGNATLTKYNLK
jgi:uncharacterized protein YjiK